MRHRNVHARVGTTLAAPANLLAGACAVLLAALTWNPLPLVLFGLGQPLWLYHGSRAPRQLPDGRTTLAWRERQLQFLLLATPCSAWIRRGHLPDYPAVYARLVAMRDQAAGVVAARHDAIASLEQDIVARMDDMLRAYLMMTRERLLFHCALAKVYPLLPELAPAQPPTLLSRLGLTATPEPAPVLAWTADTPFASLADARGALEAKLAHFRASSGHAEVYQPVIDALTARLADLDGRAAHDATMAAQLSVFPDQFELILAKLASTHADVDEVITDMKLLLEQTDDTVRFAEDARVAERHTLVAN